MIDPLTRDIVEDERAMEVYKKPDGKLGLKVLGTIAQVKDPCKEQRVTTDRSKGRIMNRIDLWRVLILLFHLGYHSDPRRSGQ